MIFDAPALEYSALAPMLVIFGAAVIAVIVEAFVSARHRAPIQLAIALGAVVLSFAQVLRLRGTSTATAAVNSVVVDGPVLFMQGTILVLAFFAFLLLADTDAFAAQASAVPGSNEERTALQTGKIQTEVYPLTLFAVGGMMLFPAANDLITLFVALEVLSLPLYLMAGLSRRRRLLSQEAALKYFLLGAYSSAFFLFGAAFLYGFAGDVSLGAIHSAVAGGSGNEALLLIGLVSLSVGLLFKVGAAPFHSWTPDVYQGAPTPITAFMAAATKVAAFGAMLRIFYVALGGAVWTWKPLITAVAILTMVVGSVIAIAQRDVKRMLAYSSIAHAGFLLTGVLALNQEGLKASLFYLASYGVSTLGAFALVTLVRDSSGEVTDLNRWVGLAKRLARSNLDDCARGIPNPNLGCDCIPCYFRSVVAMSSVGIPNLDANLEQELARGLEQVEKLLSSHIQGDYPLVVETSRHLVEAGGKRFRPLITLIASHFGKGQTKEVIEAAVVCELTHVATLYHDDVMDEAPLRRGVESANNRWGNTVAILTGDYLFSKASDLLADLGPEAVRLQAKTFERLVIGQIQETQGPKSGSDPLTHYLQVVADKTGSLIATSARFGALLADADKSIVETLTVFGEKIGIAFQLADDVIDIESDSSQSGKTPGTDLKEGVPTLVTLQIMRSDRPEDAELKTLLSAPMDDATVAQVIPQLRNHQALKDAKPLVQSR